MLTTEKAFDILPSVSEIYEKLDIGSYVKNRQKETDKTIEGLKIFAYVLKQTPKIKEEVFEIVAAVEEKSVEEVKQQNFTITLKTFKGIFQDKETMDFFKEAMN